MKRKLTCIVCPRGCALEVDENLNVTGNFCPRGKEYAIQEVSAPKRNIATIIPVSNRKYLMLSVRTSAPIPKDKIFIVMSEIKKTTVSAPVNINDVVISNILGLGVDIIATKTII